MVNLAACRFLRSKCSRALAYADRDRSRVTATLGFRRRRVSAAVGVSPLSSCFFVACVSASKETASSSSSSSSSSRFTSPTVTALFLRSRFFTRPATGLPCLFSSSTKRSISSQLCPEANSAFTATSTASTFSKLYSMSVARVSCNRSSRRKSFALRSWSLLTLSALLFAFERALSRALRSAKDSIAAKCASTKASKPRGSRTRRTRACFSPSASSYEFFSRSVADDEAAASSSPDATNGNGEKDSETQVPFRSVFSTASTASSGETLSSKRNVSSACPSGRIEPSETPSSQSRNSPSAFATF